MGVHIYNFGEDINFNVDKYIVSSTAYQKHMHSYMQINYISSGKAIHVINDKEIEIVKGDIFIIPPFISHVIKKNSDYDCEIYEFEFMPSFINQNFENPDGMEGFFDFAYIAPFLSDTNNILPRFSLSGAAQLEIDKMIHEALWEYENKKDGYQLMIKALLLKVLVICAREFNNKPIPSSVFETHKKTVLELSDYILTHYNEDLQIEDLAKKFMISNSYCRYLFKNITTKTMKKYIIDLRIAKAKEMLLKTDASIAYISGEVGFNNVTHFNRMFKKETGYTPSNFRNGIRN